MLVESNMIVPITRLQKELTKTVRELSETGEPVFILKNNAMEEVRRYSFVNAWPVAYEGPSFAAGGSELAVEMIEIAHHGLTIS